MEFCNQKLSIFINFDCNRLWKGLSVKPTCSLFRFRNGKVLVRYFNFGYNCVILYRRKFGVDIPTSEIIYFLKKCKIFLIQLLQYFPLKQPTLFKQPVCF